MRAKRFAEALKIFETNDKTFAPNAENLNNLGVVLLEMRRYKEAISVFNRALEITPENESVRYNLAIAQLAFKDKKAALEQYSFLKKTNTDLARKLFENIYKGKIIFLQNR